MPKTPTISFVSLGCSKNLVDSERMLGLLGQDGYALVPDSQPSDLVIINTCGFIDAARRESIGVIEEMLERKRSGAGQGRDRRRLPGRAAERVACSSSFPRSTTWSASSAATRSPRVADRLLGGLNEQRELFRPAPVQAQDDRARLRITPRHLAYLKVSEGCDRFCTFCAIPFMRGKHVTKPIEMVVAEAEELAADGVRELILVAQDMTYYGLDLYGRPRLAELLREIDQVEGIDWIRILYCYPQFFTDELYDVLGNNQKIIPYLDMPLQHINDRMLKQMNRRHNRHETETIIARLRATIPGLVLRTTMIVGFPGETEAEFTELEEFVTATRFERLGAFTYSFEPDTPAAKLPDHLPDEVKEERKATLMSVQQPIAFAFNQTQVGRTLDVLIDAPAPEGKNMWLGRTYADAPDVDGNTWVRGRAFQARRPGRVRDRRPPQEHDLLPGRCRHRPRRKRRARPRPRRKPQSSLAILDGM